MRVRAISHQIMIAIQSTFDGSIVRHPHDTMDLLFSCCMMTQYQTFPCIHSRTFTNSTTSTLARGQNPDFIRHRNAMISHPLLHLQFLSCPYVQLSSSRPFSLHSDVVVIFTDTEPSLSLSLVDSSSLAFLPALEEYSKNIPLKCGPLTSTQRKSFDQNGKDPTEWCFLIVIQSCHRYTECKLSSFFGGY